jgi:hypothetical protein
MTEAEQRGGLFDGTIGKVPGQKLNEQGIYSPYPVGPNTVQFTRVVNNNVCYKLLTGSPTTDTVYMLPGIEIPPTGRYRKRTSKAWDGFLSFVEFMLYLLVLAAPYAIIGGLTRFKVGNSTTSERGWTMSWLVIGQIAGAVTALGMKADKGKFGSRMGNFLGAVIVFGAPTIGGMVMVGKMIKEFGACVLV